MPSPRAFSPRRRRLLGAALAGTALAGGTVPRVLSAAGRGDRPRVLVVGGGFAGATAARYLAAWGPHVAVTLVSLPGRYWTCPFSNTALVDLRAVDALEVDPEAAARRFGYTLMRGRAVDLDPEAGTLTLAGGRTLGWDRLVLAPGIELLGQAIEGYGEDGEAVFPHAWHAGPPTADLRRRLRAVPDGGLVVITAPPNPYRCPPGPYERASLMAWWLGAHRRRTKVLILDAKDAFTKDALFRAAWARRYGDALEWRGASDGATLRRVDPGTSAVFTDFDRFDPDLACVIPPQRAAAIARRAGLDEGRGWCPVDPRTFESTVHPGVHVIGDAAIANPMPKSAFAANSQGKACAAAVLALLDGVPAPEPVLLNTCYSLVAPDAGIAIAGAYGLREGRLATLPGTAGVSPLDADAAVREAEAQHARGWYGSVVADAWGA